MMASAEEKSCFLNTGAAFLNAGPFFVLSVCDDHANEGNTSNQYFPFRKSIGNSANGISDIPGLFYETRSRVESDGVSQLKEEMQCFICALLTHLAAAGPWMQQLSAQVNSRRGEPHKIPAPMVGEW
jgi:hypothetical protein